MASGDLFRWMQAGLLLLGALMIAGCQGVLEVQIERVSAEGPPPLGQVAYIAGGDVWLHDLDGGEETRLTRDGLNHRPRLSPDGGWVAYLKGDYLHAAPVSGGGEARISEHGISDYAWSPLGTQLAYASTSGLSIWDADSQISRDLQVDLPAAYRLAWHPDGQWLALDNGEGSPRQVLKVSTDGQARSLVFSASGLMDVPRLAGWSPDGRWLALWVGSRAPAAEQDGLPLCLIPAEGGALTCQGDHVLVWPDYLTWSADGRLAVIAGSGRETWVGKGLALLDPETGASQVLIPGVEQAPIQPAGSPVEGLIAYSGGPPTPIDVAYERRDQALLSRHIWVIDPASGLRGQLTSDGSYRDERPLWSADGSHILFVRLNDQAASLWIMDAAGKGLREVVPELTPRPDPMGDYGHIDWGNWWDWN